MASSFISYYEDTSTSTFKKVIATYGCSYSLDTSPKVFYHNFRSLPFIVHVTV